MEKQTEQTRYNPKKSFWATQSYPRVPLRKGEKQITNKKDLPQYNPTKNSLWNFKYAYEQGKSQREKEILEIIDKEIKTYDNLIKRGKYLYYNYQTKKEARARTENTNSHLLCVIRHLLELKSKIKGEGK